MFQRPGLCEISSCQMMHLAVPEHLRLSGSPSLSIEPTSFLCFSSRRNSILLEFSLSAFVVVLDFRDFSRWAISDCFVSLAKAAASSGLAFASFFFFFSSAMVFFSSSAAFFASSLLFFFSAFVKALCDFCFSCFRALRAAFLASSGEACSVALQPSLD